MNFEKKPYVPSQLALEAKTFVEQHGLFTPQPQALGLSEVPFSEQMAGWMWKKNIQTMPMIRMAVEFFLGLYLRDVVMKRAPGTDGFDATTGAPTRLCDSAEHTAWCTQMLYVVQRNLVFLDQFMFTYLCAATAGELRHSLSKASGVPKPLLEKWLIITNGKVSSRTVTQAQFLKNLDVKQSSAYLDDADQIFRKYKWGGSYGGKKWADIAKTGRDRAKQETDPVMFVDRVFDLKHNGGPMFDKNSIISQSYLPHFLDAKFNLTEDDSWTGWLKYITKDMAEVLDHGRSCGLWKGSVSPSGTISKLPQTLSPQEGEATGYVDDVEMGEPIPTKDKTPAFKLSDQSCPKGHLHT